MGARGRVPTVQQDLDDRVLDLHLSAAAQVTNTQDMQEDVALILADGLVDERDWPYIRSLLARIKAEHHMNLDQAAGMSVIRRLLNPFFALLTKTRSDNQRLKKQLARGQ